MGYPFADRMMKTQKSFIREMLKTASSPGVISFGGGMPNPSTFPVEAVKRAAVSVLDEEGASSLQYDISEGYPPLRRYIADRYKKTMGLDADPSEILITTGAQQALELIGKTFINQGDRVAVESPTFLGAIQVFSLFEPEFKPAAMRADGVDLDDISHILEQDRPKLFYSIPSFQNPTGLSYSEDKIKSLSRVFSGCNTVYVEDNPYTELRFKGSRTPSMRNFKNDNIILIGSFSKLISPGIRLGWIYTNTEFIDKLVISKQGNDLHTSGLDQRIIYRYLAENDLDKHIEGISGLYKRQSDIMVSMIEKYLPMVSVTKPDGGMFLWITLPEGMSAMKLFEFAVDEGVAFVPGIPFFIAGKTPPDADRTMRLSFATTAPDDIEEGMKRLARAIGRSTGKAGAV